MGSNQQTQNLKCTKGSWVTHSLFLCIVVMAANINPQHFSQGLTMGMAGKLKQHKQRQLWSTRFTDRYAWQLDQPNQCIH